MSNFSVETLWPTGLRLEWLLLPSSGQWRKQMTFPQVEILRQIRVNCLIANHRT